MGIVIATLLPSAAAAAPEGSPAARAAGPDASRLSDPEFLAKARAYTRGNYLLYLADQTLSFTVLAFLTFLGLSGRAWGWIRLRAGGGARGTLLYLAALIVFLSLVSLPLDYYDGFVREHAYGFSTQTTGSWFADRFKGLALTTAFAALFVVPLFAVIRRFPRIWWILGAALGCAFALFLVVIEPVFVAPLFNEFTPLQDGELREQILGMAHRQGIAADEVFQMDASTRSVHDNAYVAGLFGTERIVLYDTLLQNYTRDEVAFVMGHEMGHYVLNHIWKGLALAFALIVSGFYGVDLSVRRVCERHAARTRFTSPGDLSTLPFMLLVLSVFLFVTLPIQSAYSRRLESAADRFALENVDRPQAGPGAFRKMASRNLSDPEPPALIEWFLYSHPAIGKRIRAAEAFVAASGGGPS